MLSRLSREQSLALLLAVIRTVWCGWRAATQSIVHDEAFTYLFFVSHSWRYIYLVYNASNHLLFSFLSKLSISLFGLGEFQLRLPTVIAGFFLLLGFWRILEYVPSRMVRWSAFIALALNPPLLDFSVAARGYALSLALLVWAIYAVMESRYAISGLLLGLAVSANFVTGLPAAGLIAAAVLLAQGSPSTRLRILAIMAVTSALPFFLICGGALRVITPGDLYAGEATVSGSLNNLVYTSLHATPRNGFVQPGRAAHIIVDALLPLLGLFFVVRCYLAFKAGDRKTLLVPLAFFLSASVLLLAHRFLGLLLPRDRTGLVWMVMLAVTWSVTAGTSGNKFLVRANVVVACFFAAQFLTQLHMDYLTVWWYDRPIKNIARQLEAITRDRPPDSVEISVTWINHPALEFYRLRDHVVSWKPIPRQEPTRLTGYDYYVLNLPDTDSAEARAFTVLASDSFSGVVLAK
jgi:hypothetical protein